jgi:hypothetical protein
MRLGNSFTLLLFGLSHRLLEKAKAKEEAERKRDQNPYRL